MRVQVVGILVGFLLPYIMHTLGLYKMDVLEQYVEKSQNAFRLSQVVSETLIGTDKPPARATRLSTDEVHC